MGRPCSRLAGILAVLALAGCAGPSRPARLQEPPFHPPTAMLLPYAAKDGSLTRSQLIAGLRGEFAKLDAKHSGCLDQSEVRVINERRWKEDESTASPLIDFKNNGCVDFDEFAAAPLSLFEQLDRDGAGRLTAVQLKPGAAKSTSGKDVAPAAEKAHDLDGGER